MASRIFREPEDRNQAESFFQLNFNVHTDVDNRERARARDKKQRERISLEGKYEK